MSAFHRLREYVRCAITGTCDIDTPTTNEAIIELREEEVAAKTATAELRSRREAMRPESGVNAVYDRIVGNHNGGTHG